MAEVNFCPFCDSPSHKLIVLDNDLFYCKQCENFFVLSERKLECSKCGSKEIRSSDFPAPDGSLIFQCEKCKKMFDIKTFLKNNEKEEDTENVVEPEPIIEEKVVEKKADVKIAKVIEKKAVKKVVKKKKKVGKR